MNENGNSNGITRGQEYLALFRNQEVPTMPEELLETFLYIMRGVLETAARLAEREAERYREILDIARITAANNATIIEKLRPSLIGTLPSIAQPDITLLVEAAERARLSLAGLIKQSEMRVWLSQN